VPLVILPIAGDQPYCAKRCQALGVARVIGPAQRHPQAIRTAVRAVLRDPAYRDRARHMRDDIHALPPAGAAVEALERLAHEHVDGIQP
jgi:UDP:flavonoid glycosyltransferase YjiC (YdhE family)